MLREIGKDLYGFVLARVVRIDKDDNIWCVDEGSNMVIEFNPEGHVILTIGRRAEPSEAPRPAGGTIPPARPNYFNRPTDIQWDSAGNGYITDGYGNSRVAKVDKNGKWVTAGASAGPIRAIFTPHSLAIDAQNRIYVGDRENNRIQVFDTDGKLLKQFTNVGAPLGGMRVPATVLCIRPRRAHKLVNCLRNLPSVSNT